MSNLLEVLLGIDAKKLKSQVETELTRTRGFPLNIEPSQQTIDLFERYIILEALARTKGNLTYASKILETNRRTLQRKISAFNMKQVLYEIREGKPILEPVLQQGIESIVRRAVESTVPLNELGPSLAQRIIYQGVPALSQEVLQSRPYKIPDLRTARTQFEAGLLNQMMQHADKEDVSRYLGVSVRTINRILERARHLNSYERKAA